MIEFYCPSCGKFLKAKPQLAGRKVQCSNPSCKATFRTPAESVSPEVIEALGKEDAAEQRELVRAKTQAAGPSLPESAPIGDRAHRKTHVVQQRDIRLNFPHRPMGETFTDVVRKSMRRFNALSDEDLDEFSKDKDLRREHRAALAELTPVGESVARRLFDDLNIEKFMRLSEDKADDVLNWCRVAALRGPFSGKLYYLTIGEEPGAKECMFVKHVNEVGWVQTMITCRLREGGFLVHNRPDLVLTDALGLR